MLSAYAIGQMEKALQQPPIMAALIDAQDRVRRFARDFCVAASWAGETGKHKASVHGCKALDIIWMLVHPACCQKGCAEAMLRELWHCRIVFS